MSDILHVDRDFLDIHEIWKSYAKNRDVEILDVSTSMEVVIRDEQQKKPVSEDDE